MYLCYKLVTYAVLYVGAPEKVLLDILLGKHLDNTLIQGMTFYAVMSSYMYTE